MLIMVDDCNIQSCLSMNGEMNDFYQTLLLEMKSNLLWMEQWHLEHSLICSARELPPSPPHLIMIKIMNNYFSSNGQTFGPNFLSETLTFYRILKCLTILTRKT